MNNAYAKIVLNYNLPNGSRIYVRICWLCHTTVRSCAPLQYYPIFESHRDFIRTLIPSVFFIPLLSRALALFLHQIPWMPILQQQHKKKTTQKLHILCVWLGGKSLIYWDSMFLADSSYRCFWGYDNILWAFFSSTPRRQSIHIQSLQCHRTIQLESHEQYTIRTTPKICWIYFFDRLA